MKQKFNLVTTGNTEPPIYFLLIEKGYQISTKHHFWVAENEISKFISETLVGLAGLIHLYENRGQNWRISDEKIDEFVKQFDDSGL